MGVFLLVAQAASAAVYLFDPRSTFLHDDTGGTDALIVPLSSLGLAAGDMIFLQTVGDFDPYGGNSPEEARDAEAVFSSPGLLLANDQMDRVPGSHLASFSFTSGASFTGLPREIPDDFLIPHAGVTLQIPMGSHYILLGAVDDHYGLNADYNNNWGVSITAIPEPGAVATMAGGLALGAAFIRRWRRRA